MVRASVGSLEKENLLGLVQVCTSWLAPHKRDVGRFTPALSHQSGPKVITHDGVILG